MNKELITSLLFTFESEVVTEWQLKSYLNEINGRGNSSRWPRNILYPQKLALTSLTSGSLSVGIVRLRTKAMAFIFFFSGDWIETNLSLEWVLFWPHR
jgi:hypothetical protein